MSLHVPFPVMSFSLSIEFISETAVVKPVGNVEFPCLKLSRFRITEEATLLGRAFLQRSHVIQIPTLVGL